MIIDELFPEKGKLVITANGREFFERLGLETVRDVILTVLKGENIRTKTEPISRTRIGIVTGALFYLFLRGWADIEGFTDQLSTNALEQMDNTTQSNKASFWPAMWLIGLTGKSIQNVLRSDSLMRKAYISDFEDAVEQASQKCLEDFGPISIKMGYFVNGEMKQNVKPLDWKDVTRLTTAIGSATLSVRGSEKSTYGKLFEHLILGSVLSILGFEHVENSSSGKLNNVFWLSDSSDLRECDATIRLSPGRLARFDIGFIGTGNPEIMKDKLSRFAQEIEQNGFSHFSQSFIVVDKMPNTSKTINAALKAGAEIVQMSMQYWAVDLARRIKNRLGFEAEILSVSEDKLGDYIEAKLKLVSILDFVKNYQIRNNSPHRIKESDQPYLLDFDEDSDLDNL